MLDQSSEMDHLKSVFPFFSVWYIGTLQLCRLRRRNRRYIGWYEPLSQIPLLNHRVPRKRHALFAGAVDFACSESLLDILDSVVIRRKIQMLPVLRENLLCMIAKSAVVVISLISVQVFAGAVSLIYSAPNVDNMILSRRLANDILLGLVSSW
jgi:hypothetical protein